MLLSEVEGLESAATTVRRLLQAGTEPHAIDQHDLHVTSCVGVSIYPDDGLDPETLISASCCKIKVYLVRSPVAQW